jgi:hypothetical protein
MSYNNQAYQYSCEGTSERSTGPLSGDQEQMHGQQEQPQYRFDFPEFEGRKGFLLLDKILDTIIPQAAYKVWRKIYDLVQCDPKPYIGSEAIAAQADVTYRQINRALQALKEMGLMEEVPSIAYSKDGKGFAVIRKDFTNLYKFAHEYHLWMNSQGFAMYPPDRKFASLIEANRHLYAKLVRFENYRIILKTEKRGPKQVMTELVRWDSKDTIKLDQNVQLGEAMNNDLEICVGTSKYQRESLYESDNSNYLASIKASNHAQDLNLIQDSPLLGGSGGEHPQFEGGTHEEDFDLKCGKGSNEEYSFEIPSATQENISQRETNPKDKRNVPQTAKELSPQQKGKALIEAVLNEEDRKAHTPKQERRNKWLESEELRKECKGIVNMYSHIADRLNDQNPKSTETLLAKMQKEIGMSDEEFIKHVDYARQKVLSIPQDKIRKRGADGQPNRTPLFLQILKDALKRGIAACQEDDRRADEIRNMFRVVEQPAPQLDQEPEIDQEVFNQVVDECLRPALEARHQTREEIMAKVEAVEPEQDPAAQEPEIDAGYQDWHDQLEASAKEIKAATGLNAYVGGECQECGCKIKIRVGWTPVCGWCKPHESWSDEVRTQVLSAIREVYEVA